MEAELGLPHVHPPHGGDLKKVALRFGVEVTTISDFSININSLGMPVAAAQAARESIQRCGTYPDIRYEELRLALSCHYKLEPEQILPLAGAAEGIFLTASAFRGQPAVILTPAFNEYAAAAQGHGSQIYKIPYREDSSGFSLPVELVFQDEAGRLLESPVVYLGNPNNPTGHLNAKADLLALACQLWQQGGVLVVDESFLDFVPGRENISMLDRAVASENILVIVSLTKFFAMPGLRIGFAAGSRDVLSRIAAIQPSWGIATPAVEAGLHSLNDIHFVDDTHRWVAQERSYLSQALSANDGVKVFPAAANFLLLDLQGTGRTSAWWQEQLVRRGFLLRLCEDFDALEGRCLRVAVRLHPDNLALAEAFKAVFEDLQSLGTL